MNTIKSYLMKEKCGMSHTTEVILITVIVVGIVVVLFGTLGPVLEKKTNEITTNIENSGSGWGPKPSS